jgi:hypothetical protein
MPGATSHGVPSFSANHGSLGFSNQMITGTAAMRLKLREFGRFTLKSG